MNREQFEALVRQLEEYARRQPASYRRRVGLLAALGYGYIFFMLILALGLLGFVAWVTATGHMNYGVGKVGLAMLVLCFVIVRALFVSIPAPSGIRLQRQEVPRLFDMVDRLSAALKAPRFHRILLTGDFNAAVAQRPRLGIFGWQQNYLLLGLPLMEALSPEQFRAVVAHELGHLSGNHSRFAGWIYRVRKTWDQLLKNLQAQKSKAIKLFVWFFRWYAPLFSAYSFVLARSDEYIADRCAAQIAGAKTCADALIRIHLQAPAVEETFWPGVYKQVEAQEEPPAGVFTSLAQALRAGTMVADPIKSLHGALAEQAGYADTHPSLADRLRALGCLPASETPELLLPAPVEETAAEYFLGGAVERLWQTLDQVWRQDVTPVWKERHRYVQTAQRQLQALEEKAQTQPLTEEEAWKRAEWTAEFKGNAAALPLLQKMLAAKPEDPKLRFAYGSLLLEEGDAAGIAHIEQAMQREPDSVLPGCRAVYAFLMQQGRAEEANQYRQRFEQHTQLEALAEAERSHVSVGDRFLPHGLPTEKVAALAEQLACYLEVAAVYLVRKELQYFPNKPFFVLGIQPVVKWYESRSEETDGKLIRKIASEVRLPGDTSILVMTRNKKVGSILRQMPGAEIFRRQKGRK
ncbi:MAG TPA: M48 family metalloprotease [Chthonomonadaceae bacterium]|nr:M48 family metalloprotease [Chthonomonadaceae bacterium]